jgi:hypothetical protein
MPQRAGMPEIRDSRHMSRFDSGLAIRSFSRFFPADILGSKSQKTQDFDKDLSVGSYLAEIGVDQKPHLHHRLHVEHGSARFDGHLAFVKPLKRVIPGDGRRDCGFHEGYQS